MAETRREETENQGGHLAENVMFFARTLRAAGLPVGPGRVLEALRAVQAVGIERRDDFYWALHAVLVDRRDQQPLFDQAFHVFWRNPKLLQRMLSVLLPELRTQRPDEDSRETLSRRLAEALKGDQPGGEDSEREEQEEIDAALTWSDKEILRTMDFEKMSNAEVEQAKRAIEGLRLPLQEIRTRRFRPDPRGARADLRRSLRAALRSGSDSIPLKRRSPRFRPPPLVVLCDVSGSMARYSRLALHFMHRLTNDRDRVHSFVFGTELHNVTRSLRQKDVDLALDKLGKQVTDWSGGTRIGACLHAFNRDWSRRVLTQGGVVILITDGLDRDDASQLAVEMERLHKSSRRLIWLNPLLRYDGYAPKSQGARALLPHVDEFRSVHNLDSLVSLSEALSRPLDPRRNELDSWLEKME